MSIHTFFVVALFCFSLTFPNISLAYNTTKQHAFTVNGTTGLFTVEFVLGHGKHDVFVPVHALSGRDSTPDALGYRITDSEGEPAHGTSLGIVLGAARVENGMYHIPKGQRVTFTLLTFFTPQKDQDLKEYHLNVTNLPFSFNGTQQLRLNPSELKAYATPSVALD